MGDEVVRHAPAEITTRGEGAERLIEAYAAVFDTPTEIRDRDGHYLETIDRSAFARTLDHHPDGRGIKVLFNHGRSLDGTSAERFTLPYGVPVSLRADDRGLLTIVRAVETPLGDEIYQLAREGALDSMSFSARSLRQTRTVGRGTDLDTIHRTEFALVEFGLVVHPAYSDAQVVGVRSQTAPATSADDNRAAQEHARQVILAAKLAGRETGAKYGFG